MALKGEGDGAGLFLFVRGLGGVWAFSAFVKFAWDRLGLQMRERVNDI
ncbi:MAG: hypothetical protein ACE5IF_00660 [Candidatus Bathyarchaeia archaeon]